MQDQYFYQQNVRFYIKTNEHVCKYMFPLCYYVHCTLCQLNLQTGKLEKYHICELRFPRLHIHTYFCWISLYLCMHMHTRFKQFSNNNVETSARRQINGVVQTFCVNLTLEENKNVRGNVLAN